MGRTIREKPAVIPKKAFKFQTFAIVRNYDGRVFVARILSDKKITGRGTKPGAMKYALKFQKGKEKIEYYRINKTWDNAQNLELGTLKILVNKLKPTHFSFDIAENLFKNKGYMNKLESRTGVRPIQPNFSPVGESERMITRKTVPMRRKKKI